MDSGAESILKVRLADGKEFGPAPLSMIAQWAREGRIPPSALLVTPDESRVISVLAEPLIAGIIQAPPTVFTGVQQPDGSMGGMIPYKNPPALFGYYLAVFSLIPMIGLMLGIPAVICGIVGLRKAKLRPERRGKAHAWVAIILGGITSLVYGALFIMMIIGASQ